jgi:hypothetical protein
MGKQIIISILVGILTAFLILWFMPKEKETIVVPEIRENVVKIDSLKARISRDSLVIDSLKRTEKQIVEKIVVRVEKQKTLPVDSAISVFSEYLEKYGELGSEEPKLLEDSTVLCSADNIRDANIMAVKLDGALERIDVLDEIVELDSQVIERKDSIIYENSVILLKTETAYKESIDNLSAVIKKEKRKSKVAYWIGGAAAIILGSLLIAK